MVYTMTDVADRIEQAVHTLRRLPPVKVQGYKSSWPSVLQDFHESYGYNEAQVRMGSPSAKHISQMDEVLGWLLWLDAYESKIVFLRANNVRWKRIEQKLGYGRTKLSFDWKVAILKITTLLNKPKAASSHSLPYKKMCAQNTCEHIDAVMA